MNKLIFTLSLFFALFSHNTFAQESEKAITANFLLEGGIEFGGDEILKIFFTNGGDQSMKAGQGGYIGLGGQFQFTKVKNLSFRTTVGIKYVTTAAENANIRFTRIPINLMGYWSVADDFRIGLGVTTHQNAKFKGDGLVPDNEFSSSIGPRFEIGYKWFAVTYTALNYTAETDEEYSANAIGFSLSYVFPGK